MGWKGRGDGADVRAAPLSLPCPRAGFGKQIPSRRREKWILLLHVQPRPRGGAETFPSPPGTHKLWNSSKTHLTPPSSIPGYFCSARSSGTVWEHKPLCPKHSQPWDFPTAPRMLRDGWNSLGKASALHPEIQGSPDLQILAFHRGNPCSIRAWRAGIPKAGIPHHSSQELELLWFQLLQNVLCRECTFQKKKGNLQEDHFPLKQSFRALKPLWDSLPIKRKKKEEEKRWN